MGNDWKRKNRTMTPSYSGLCQSHYYDTILASFFFWRWGDSTNGIIGHSRSTTRDVCYPSNPYQSRTTASLAAKGWKSSGLL